MIAFIVTPYLLIYDLSLVSAIYFSQGMNYTNYLFKGFIFFIHSKKIF